MRGPRFEQTNMDLQPQPVSAAQLISEEPIRLVEKRIASCDGGESDPVSVHAWRCVQLQARALHPGSWHLRSPGRSFRVAHGHK